jgi:hypothetical protein
MSNYRRGVTFVWMSCFLAAFLLPTYPVAVAQNPRSAPDILPLKHGTYVKEDTPCNQISYSSVIWYDGHYIYAPHDFGPSDRALCTTTITSHVGNRYAILRSCRGGSSSESPIVTYTYDVLGPVRFSWITQGGSFIYRMCTEGQLPRDWRGTFSKMAMQAGR